MIFIVIDDHVVTIIIIFIFRMSSVDATTWKHVCVCLIVCSTTSRTYFATGEEPLERALQKLGESHHEEIDVLGVKLMHNRGEDHVRLVPVHLTGPQGY